MRPSIIIAIVAALLVTAGVGALGLMQTQRSVTKMQAVSTSAAAFQALAPGAPTKLVLKISRVDGARLNGALLERRDGAYRSAGSSVEVRMTADTEVVMGAAADIKPGAVVQISGRVTPDHAVEAGQLVLITRFVRVDPQGAPA